MDTAEEISGSLTVEQCATNDDKGFFSFYYKAIKRLLDIDIKANASYLHRYFKIFCQYFDFWCQVKQNLEDRDDTIISLFGFDLWCRVKHNLQFRDDTIISLLEDSLYYRLAFVYKNATLLSSAVAFHFRNVYKISPTNINTLMKKKLVKICSLGGCAASDIVAIVTVLESIALKNGIELDFRVTIIESDERWKITCITVLSCLEQFRKATWKITFVQGNLAEKDVWTPSTCKAIQEADIITLIRFLTKFNLKNIKKICDKVQPQAMLFILDHPVKEVIELSFDVTDSDDFELIHKELWDFHALDIEAVNHFETLYQKHFGDHKQFQANLSFNVFIGVWIKVSAELKCQKNIECIFQDNAEKCNPKQSFLGCNAVTRWENLFTKAKEAEGWNAKGIRKYIQQGKERRYSLLVELINERKKLDMVQKDLLNKLQTLKKEEKESNKMGKESFKSYLIQKNNYSLKKRTIYYDFLYYNKKDTA